jgi:hypothetical protein
VLPEIRAAAAVDDNIYAENDGESPGAADRAEREGRIMFSNRIVAARRVKSSPCSSTLTR